MTRKKAAPTFKTYSQNQMRLIPQTWDEMVPANHPVRVVNQVVDSLDLSALIKSYKGGGNSSYHPAMLLKVIVYSYLRNIYSTRKMEEALQENVHFIWLAGGNQPDHNTLARFRSQRLKGKVKAIFGQVVEMLVEAGVVSLQECFVDGTKIEANANRYTFVWGRSIAYNKERIKEQLRELLAYADRVHASEAGPSPEFPEIDAQKVKETIDRINEALKDVEVDPKVKQKLKYAEKHWPQALDRYAEQEAILGKRNSYSKTDPDATFMRMKEDHMRNGQLKPGYNVQASTENQFLTNYTVHPNPTDTKTLPEHVESFKDLHGKAPVALTADAGYGSEENYEYLAKEGVEAFVKFNKFDQERNKGIDPFSPEAWDYDPEKDSFFCPQGRELVHVGKSTKRTESGYEGVLDRYRSLSCAGCPVRDKCTKTDKDKEIEVSHKLRQHRQTARERLTSPEGIARRKQRCHDTETVFGQLKHNKGFRRFFLRGKAKVEVEFGILAIAHNLEKLARVAS